MTIQEINSFPGFWTHWEPASCQPGCQCEQDRGAEFGFRQPTNAISSLAFFACATFILTLSMKYTTKTGLLSAVSVLVLGFASVFFHASLSKFGEIFEAIASYHLLLLFTFEALERATVPTHSSATIPWRLIHIISTLITGAIVSVWTGLEHILFGMLSVGLLLAQTRACRSPRAVVDAKWFMPGLLLFLCGVGLWAADKSAFTCHPASWIQLHSLWHATCALSIACLYLSNHGSFIASKRSIRSV
eukprot:TRINITY_DN114105_c0_g1_i1.p1 TRINITY_DN114105_c0_g1~~TRINITY_DN114105_c0_g1_i1.p1  ORF type:complete len:253 (-),score=-7.65 TRINITY_DN114105_c0_g1_i1:41-778(-)